MTDSIAASTSIRVFNAGKTRLTVCVELDGLEFVANPGDEYEITTRGEPGVFVVRQSPSALTVISWLTGSTTFRKVNEIETTAVVARPQEPADE